MVEISEKEFQKIQDIQELAESTINTVREPFIVLDGNLKVASASRSFYQFFKVKPEETENHFIYDLGNKQWDIPGLRELLEKILPSNESFDDYEVEHDFPNLGRRIMLLNARRIPRPPEKPRVILLAIEDITERRQAERVRRLATVVQDSNDAITIQNFEGNITAWNHGAELMFGYSEQEALQMTIWQLAPSNKADEQKDFNRRIFAGENIPSFETQRLTKDGRLLDVWLTVTKLVDDAGKVIGIASTERNITERKRLENEKEKILYNLGERVKELKCIAEISRLAEQPGITIEKFVEAATDLMPSAWQYPEDSCARITLDGTVFKTGNFKETPWNQSSDIHVNGKTFGKILVCYLKEKPPADEGPFLKEERELINVVADFLGHIIQHRRTEQEIRQSEAQLKEAQVLGRIGSWEYDVNSKKIFWSDETYILYGRDPALEPPTEEEEVHYYSPEQVKILRDYAVRSIKNGEEFKYDLTANLLGGRQVFFSATMHPIRDESGQVVKLIGTVQDITERKRAEEKLKSNLVELQEIAKAATGRELKMIDIEKEVNALLKELGREPKYK